MKFEQTDMGVVVKSNGIEDNKQFTIASNAKMFKLLSSGLYNFKIRAVIRELACNALDAHIMNGNPEQPFTVELPSDANGYTFRIRDFGVGLSQEQINNLYTVYGASNKADSNACIGGMGLGSKSPLCYVKTFNVTSYYNGKKYIYNCGFDETGIPECSFFAECDTIEPNGLEISLIANRGDYYSFSSEASYVFRNFTVLPIFIGTNKPSQIIYYKTALKDKKVKGLDAYITGRENYVIMGQVQYPLASDEFRTKHDDNAADPWIREANKQLNTYSQLLGMGVAIDLEIGDAEVDIGREGLQYTKKTKAILQKKFDEIIAAIKSEVETEILNARNLYAARIAYQALVNGKYHDAVNLLRSIDIQYKGEKVNDHTTDLADLVQAANSNFNITSGQIIGNKFRKSENERYIYNNPKYKILINDVNSAQFAQAKRFLELNTQYRHATIVTLDNVAEKTFFDRMGCDKADVVYISSLPKPPRQKGSVSKDFCFLFDETRQQPYRSQRSSSRYFKEVKDDSEFDDCEIYFTIKNYEPEGALDTTAIASLLKKVRVVTGATIGKVMAVKSAHADKTIKDKSFTELKEYLKTIVLEYITKSNIAETIANCKHHEEHNTNNIMVDFEEKNVHMLVDKKSIFALYCKNSKDLTVFYDANFAKVRDISTICNLLAIDIQGKSGYNIDMQNEELRQKYPMLTQIRSHWSLNEQVVADYINMIDAK